MVYTAPAGWGAYKWAVPNGFTSVTGDTPNAILAELDGGYLYTGVSDGVNPATTMTLDVTVNPKAAIAGPLDPVTGMPVTLGSGGTLLETKEFYTTEPGMGPYT
ncbi:MAG: hypothetical protein MZV63_44495 [Marinilabiliales bacterium]|nr:hypothetical protein [Marinilabiliales bacterium]